jgi:hypothetical protein
VHGTGCAIGCSAAPVREFGNDGVLTLNLSIQAAIDHFLMWCLHVLGYSIGSAIIDTVLPLAIGIVAVSVVGLAGFVVHQRLSVVRRRRNPLDV